MGFTPITRTVQLALVADVAGEECVNTWAFKKQGIAPVSDGDLALLADAFYTRMIGPLRNCWGSFVQPQALHLRNMELVSGGVYDLYIPSGNQGNRTGEMLPLNVSLALRRKTGTPGRSFRGRIEMFGLSESDQNGGFIGTALQAAYSTLCSVMLAPFTLGNGSVYDWAVASRVHGISTVITTWLFDTKTDSQRTRIG